MWRRALLAAAVVSCTLPTHVRGARRLTRIQDLICVLIMSGLQKEDLDASTVRKLQRLDVNIADADNDRLRQQCSDRNNEITTSDRNDKIEEHLISTTEKSIIDSTEAPLSPVSLNMETVVSYLKDRHDQITSFGDMTTGTRRVIDKHVTDGLEPQTNIAEDLLRRYIQLEAQNKSVYKLDHSSEVTKHSRNINVKISDTDPKVAKNIEFLDTLFKDYLSSRQTTTTTRPTTTKHIIDVQKVYRQIDELIANASSFNNEKVKAGEGEPENESHKINTNRQNSHEPNLSENQLTKSFYNFLTQMNRFKNSMNLPLPSYTAYSHKDNGQTDRSLYSFTPNEQVKYKELITEKAEAKTDQLQNALSPKLVKEIAETVKEVIIKDLRKELSDIYLKPTQTSIAIYTTTTTTTETPSTTSTKSTIQEDSMSVMEKFMELYNEMKSLKQATSFLRTDKKPESFFTDMKYPTINPQLIPIHKPETNIGDNGVRQNFNVDPYFPRNEKNRPLPITIQTNSVEIKPLAIPLSKPESLVRQNIVVKQAHQFQTRDNTYKHSPLKSYDGYNYARFPPYAGSHNARHDREDVIRFSIRNNGNSRYDTDYYEKINFRNHNAGANENNGLYSKTNMPRFHERLERVDTRLDGISRTHGDARDKKRTDDDEVPSRQQMSLIDMKKGSSYDDRHFKNFLNTQQKVTDMLEKILAHRPNVSKVRSVETI